jgi:hypothetical protein
MKSKTLLIISTIYCIALLLPTFGQSPFPLRPLGLDTIGPAPTNTIAAKSTNYFSLTNAFDIGNRDTIPFWFSYNASNTALGPITCLFAFSADGSNFTTTRSNWVAVSIIASNLSNTCCALLDTRSARYGCLVGIESTNIFSISNLNPYIFYR